MFDGDVAKWERFWAQFRLWVHDTTERPEYKFERLRSHLKGQPLRLLDNYRESTDESSYQEAIKDLKETYGNTDLVVQRHFESLRNLPELRGEDVTRLKQFSVDLTATVRGLREKGCELNKGNVSDVVHRLPLRLQNEFFKTLYGWIDPIPQERNQSCYSDVGQ